MQVATRKTVLPTVAAILLAGVVACAPEADQVVTGGNAPITSASGLEERLPDTCKLDNYQSLVGQQLAAPPAGIDARIVRPGTILTQEYVSSRVNFHVDEAGVVTKVICG